MQTRSTQKHTGEYISDIDPKRPRFGELEQEQDQESSEEEEEAFDVISEMDFLRLSDPEVYKIAESVQEEIKRTEPKILTILKEPMSLESKTYLVQLYEIYRNSPAATLESMELRKKIIKEFDQAKADHKELSKVSYSKQKQIEAEAAAFSCVVSGKALFYKIMNLQTSSANKEVIHRKYIELTNTDPLDEEYSKLKNWITWAIEVPHDTLQTQPVGFSTTEFLQKAVIYLDNALYGMESVKEQLILFLSGKLLNPEMKRCSLGLVGLPGTGKTAIARSLATIMNYPFEQIAFGGMSDADFIKGHSYTYIGAQPGEITRCLRRMKCKNGVLFLDEYEKISDNKEVCAALLHITDPVQNSEFRDNYLSEITQDLSNIWMIYSMNSPPSDSALRDRIFEIKVPGYSVYDKIQIIQSHLLPKALMNAGLAQDTVTFGDGAASFLVNRVTTMWDKGVRTIEKSVVDIVNKISFIINHQDEEGALAGFNVSFGLNKRLVAPFKLDENLLILLCTEQIVDRGIETMYT
jgi:ATP-dependent Lon protease